MKQVSGSTIIKTGKFFLALLVAGSFVTGTGVSIDAGSAQAQEKKKRKFGPGQNALPKGVRPQGQRPAPQKQPQKPATKIVSKHGKWVIQCDIQKPGAKGKPACALIQTAVNKDNKRIGLTLVLARGKQGKEVATMMRIMAPISVYLPTGVALEVDGSAAGRVPFTRCLPQTCMAFAQVRKETLAKMKKGSKGKFLIYEAPGIGIPLDLDLSGFTAALKALDKTQE